MMIWWIINVAVKFLFYAKATTRCPRTWYPCSSTTMDPMRSSAGIVEIQALSFQQLQNVSFSVTPPPRVYPAARFCWGSRHAVNKRVGMWLWLSTISSSLSARGGSNGVSVHDSSVAGASFAAPMRAVWHVSCPPHYSTCIYHYSHRCGLLILRSLHD